MSIQQVSPCGTKQAGSSRRLQKCPSKPVLLMFLVRQAGWGSTGGVAQCRLMLDDAGIGLLVACSNMCKAEAPEFCEASAHQGSWKSPSSLMCSSVYTSSVAPAADQVMLC